MSQCEGTVLAHRKSFRKSFRKCGLWLGANLCGAAHEKMPSLSSTFPETFATVAINFAYIIGQNQVALGGDSLKNDHLIPSFDFAVHPSSVATTLS